MALISSSICCKYELWFLCHIEIKLIIIAIIIIDELKLQEIKQLPLLHHLYRKASKIKADLECLSRIGHVVNTQKKQGSVELLPFLVKLENVLAKERQRCKAWAKAKKSKANMANGNNVINNIFDDRNTFDIFNEWHFCILLIVLMLVWYWFHESICFIT